MLNFFQAVFLVLASILVVTRCAPFPQEDDSLLEEDAEYLDDAIEYSVSLLQCCYKSKDYLFRMKRVLDKRMTVQLQEVGL